MSALTLKLGGAAGTHDETLRLIASHAGPECVIVHGGGGEVGDWSRRLGIEPRFRDGLRVTDEATLEVAVAVLGGLVNARLVACLGAFGRPSIGLSGADGGLLSISRADPSLGRVGTVDRVDRGLLDALLAAGLLPVIASIGADAVGELHNLNADEVAGAVAAARGGRLVLCTDVAGVQRDGSVLRRLEPGEAEAMLEDGSASAGMRPKLRAALAAVRAGCEVQVIDGRSPETVASALAGEPVGTAVGR